MHGINLGGWLVTEPWITPSLYSPGIEDEFTLLAQEDGPSKLKNHYETFIMRADFAWIAERGFKLVRLPVGYGLFGDAEPYAPTVKYVDQAFLWAQKYGLKILLDLHTAVGSQNGAMHSGKVGEISWHKDPANIASTLATIDKIAERYSKKSELWGIELLNEPDKHIPRQTLLDFYVQGYDIVRKYCNQDIAVVVHDAYRPWVEFESFLHHEARHNVLLDTHLYQVFHPRDKKMSYDGHIRKTLRWQKMVKNFGAEKLIIGEWSTALDNVYDDLTGLERKQAIEFYRQAQLFAFSNTAAQFYWTYKTEDSGPWSLRAIL